MRLVNPARMRREQRCRIALTTIDTLIAAIALEHGTSVFTLDQDFSRIARYHAFAASQILILSVKYLVLPCLPPQRSRLAGLGLAFASSVHLTLEHCPQQAIRATPTVRPASRDSGRTPGVQTVPSQAGPRIASGIAHDAGTRN
jgi:PIN domain